MSSGSTLPQYLPNPKSEIPVKFVFTWSIFVLLSNDKKAKTISLKIFIKVDFKNLQKETAKGTLRPLLKILIFIHPNMKTLLL